MGVVSSPEKGELVKQLGAVDYIDRAEFKGMMRRGGESADEEKERFKVSRAFGKRVKEILGDSPDIVFEHVGQATFPTSVFVVKPFGKVVICAGTTGFNLDFDVRYLWMRQKEILGSHFANAYECMKANELIESGQIRPVLWRTMGFEGVPEAHQLMRDNKHLGKISILVGADEEGAGKTDRGRGRDLRGGGRVITVHIKWVANPFRGDKFAEGWAPAAEAVLDYGAVDWAFYRAKDGRLDFLQTATFPSKAHFERYWYSEQIAEAAPSSWARSRCRCCPTFHEVVGAGRRGRAYPCSSGAIVSPASASCSQ